MLQKMIRLQLAVLIATVGLAFVACSQDRPANDASSAESMGPNKGEAPTGNSVPSDNAIGTDMTPDAGSPTGPGTTDPGTTKTGEH